MLSAPPKLRSDFLARDSDLIDVLGNCCFMCTAAVIHVLYTKTRYRGLREDTKP